jgi:hypothetical protein
MTPNSAAWRAGAPFLNHQSNDNRRTIDADPSAAVMRNTAMPGQALRLSRKTAAMLAKRLVLWIARRK